MSERRSSFRPGYLAACAALAAGEAAGFVGCGLASLWPGAACAAALLLTFGYGLDRRALTLSGVCALGLALAWFSDSDRVELIDTLGRMNRPYETSLKVGKVECRGEWTTFTSSIAGMEVKAIIKRRRGLIRPRSGEIWRCAGWLGRGDVHDRGRRTFWIRGEGTFARREAPAKDSVVARVRRRLSRGLGVGIGREPVIADLNRAIFLGERERLPRELARVFTDAGTMHVFAISGLHVMVVAEILEFVLLFCFFPLRFTALAVVPALWCYVGMIGMGPSAVRAATMASLVCAAKLFGRRGDTLVAWALTFFVVHALDPAQLMKIGSVLSFSVMLGILLFLRWSRELKPNRVVAALGVSLAAWAAGTPIAAYCFGQITPGGLLANLAVIQIVPVTVVCSALGAVGSCVSGTVAGHFNNAAAMATELMIWVSRRVSEIPWANFEIGSPPPWAYAAWYAAFAAAAWAIKRMILKKRSILA